MLLGSSLAAFLKSRNRSFSVAQEYTRTTQPYDQFSVKPAKKHHLHENTRTRRVALDELFHTAESFFVTQLLVDVAATAAQIKREWELAIDVLEAVDQAPSDFVLEVLELGSVSAGGNVVALLTLHRCSHMRMHALAHPVKAALV